MIFPFIKGPKKDKSPSTLNTDGKYILKAIDFVESLNDTDEYSFDKNRIIIAGHSMGATCSIKAGATMEGNESLRDRIKLVVTQHPGICGPLGPPPSP